MNSNIITPISSLMLLVSLSAQATQRLQLSSPAFAEGEMLPVQFSCEGAGISPPLSWTGVPTGTQSLVLIMDHKPHHQPHPAHSDEHRPSKPLTSEQPPKPRDPEALRWYWTLYNIPADSSGINSGHSVGTLGGNVVNDHNEYAPPCSKGPGLKSYTFHLYALATKLDLSGSEIVSEALLRNSMRGLILDSDTLTVNFERSCQSPPKPGGQEERAASTTASRESNAINITTLCSNTNG